MVSPRDLLRGTDHVSLLTRTAAEEAGIIRFVVACGLDSEIDSRSMDLWSDSWGSPGFYQTHLGGKDSADPSRLFLDLKGGTEEDLFDTYRGKQIAVCEPCAITGMVTLSAICPIGGVGYGGTVNGNTPIIFAPDLPTVSETIRACMVSRGPYGVPIWAAEQPSPLGKATTLNGMLAYMTFVPRQIHLVPPSDSGTCVLCASTAPLIRWMAFGPGTLPPKDQDFLDPFCINKKRGGAVGAYPTNGQDVFDWADLIGRRLAEFGRPEVLIGHSRAVAYVVVANQAKIREIQRVKIQLAE